MSSVSILWGNSIGCSALGLMLRKCLAASAKLACAVVKVGDDHRLAEYGSSVGLAYPGTLGCWSQPPRTVSIATIMTALSCLSTVPEKMPARINVLDRLLFIVIGDSEESPSGPNLGNYHTRQNRATAGTEGLCPRKQCLSLVSSHAHSCDRLQSVAGLVGARTWNAWVVPGKGTGGGQLMSPGRNDKRSVT